MATYKVIQDIEAEDKILGPLTLRQFVYAGIAAIMLYLCYLVITKGFGFMVMVFLPVAAAFGFFAFPWGRDQPTEVWALAKIRFFLKPRRKIWDQSGIKELVTITAPKREVEIYSNNLSQTEVKSRLRALADTIDSRGWVIKNANVSMSMMPAIGMQADSSDRLIDMSAFAQAQPVVTQVDIQASDDMLDEKNNPRAQKVESMINASAKAHRQKLIDELNQNSPPATAPPKPANNYWFLNQPAQPTNVPSNTVTFNAQVVEPGAAPVGSPNPAAPTADEAAIVHELEVQKQKSPNASYYGHLHTIQPLSEQRKQAAAAHPTPPPLPQINQPQAADVQTTAGPPTQAPPPPVTPAKQAAILQLASNDDLNVATIARVAKRTEPDEVVIKLH